MFGINDPSALLRPWKNLTHFSEELYAMFSASGVQEGVPPGSTRGTGAETAEARQTPGRDGEDGAAANATRKTRLGDARARVRLPEPRARDSHAADARTPLAAQEGASRPRPGPPTESAAPVPPTPATPRFKAQPGGTTVDQRIVQVAPPDEHATTRRVADQTDHSTPAPDPIRLQAREGRTATEPSKPARGQEQQGLPPRTKSEAGRQSSADPGGPRGAFRADADEPKTKASRENLGLELLDIGDFANAVGGGGGDPTVFMGKVQSGSGDTYSVILYQSGPSGPPDAEPVTVTVPFIDPDETIDADTWLSPILLFPGGTDQFGNSTTDTYSCQPPVWMA